MLSSTHEQNIISTTLRMNRPLFVGNYLQVTWWAFGLIIRSPSLFLMNIFGKRSNLPFFTQEPNRKKEKSVIEWALDSEPIRARGIIVKFRDLSVSRISIIYLSLRLWQIIDLITIFCSTSSNNC